MIGVRQIIRNSGTLWKNRRVIPSVWKFLTNDSVETASISALRRLVSRGHSKTADTGLPQNWDSSPVPWYTYPFIDFLIDLDTSKWKILEFGSGQSTLYWAPRSAHILTYENSMEWFKKMQKKIPDNVEMRMFKGEETLAELPEINFQPDLIIVDGWKRGACAQRSVEQFGLKPLYILENSDWFPEAAAAMRASGLVEIRLKGFGPVNGYAWATSLMLSKENLHLLQHIDSHSEVPGGLPAGDYEQQDLRS